MCSRPCRGAEHPKTTVSGQYLFLQTEGKGWHIVFGADPVGVGISVGVSISVSVTLSFTARYHMNKKVDINQICMDIKLDYNGELIRFW